MFYPGIYNVVPQIQPRKSRDQRESPEQHSGCQSDQPGPADSDEGSKEVQEIETILDAKRSATGSVRF